MTQATPTDLPTTSFLETHKHTLFVVAVFVVVFISARIAIRPVNSVDYQTRVHASQAFWKGQDIYRVEAYYEPPWSIFLVAPLATLPLETWLALSVALFVGAIVDLGKPSGLLLLLHPFFISVIVSSNPEWLYIGAGLWLLYRAPRGWGRGLAWLLLTCKPQTSAFLLLFDGWDALRQRDWKAFGLAAVAAAISWMMYPQFLPQLSHRFDIDWSASVIFHYGVLGAAAITALIVAIRWRRLDDRKTLGILLGAVWSPYILEYGLTAILFTMRQAGWLRTIGYLVISLGLAALFWRDYHVAEHVGAAGMVLLAAIMAPAQPQATPEGESSKQTDQPSLQAIT
jgi:hypothetical protein